MASAGEATMFWGVRVEEKSSVREPINEEQSGSEDEDTLPIAEEEYVHITQVALEPGSTSKKPTTLYIEVGGTKYALGTLEQGRCEQFSLDVVVDESFELSLSGKGAVSVTGYRTLLRDMSLFDEYDSEDEDEDVEDESEEEEEEPKAANNKRTKQLEEEEEDSESEEEDEAPVTGKSKAGKKFEKAMLEKAQKKVAKETKQAKDAYDSGSDEEEDSEDDEEADVEGKEFSDMDTSGEESEEDSEEEEEAPPKKLAAAAKGSKRTAPDTPQPSSKKAKASASTPAKTPSKSPGKTPTNTPAKTPASTGATPSKSPKSVSAALKSSIEKTLKTKGKPIDMSAFGKEYEQAVGKKLDLKVEGFRKLRDLIDSVPDVATIRDDGGRLTVASP